MDKAAKFSGDARFWFWILVKLIHSSVPRWLAVPQWISAPFAAFETICFTHRLGSYIAIGVQVHSIHYLALLWMKYVNSTWLIYQRLTEAEYLLRLGIISARLAWMDEERKPHRGASRQARPSLSEGGVRAAAREKGGVGLPRAFRGRRRRRGARAPSAPCATRW